MRSGLLLRFELSLIDRGSLFLLLFFKGLQRDRSFHSILIQPSHEVDARQTRLNLHFKLGLGNGLLESSRGLLTCVGGWAVVHANSFGSLQMAIVTGTGSQELTAASHSNLLDVLRSLL